MAEYTVLDEMTKKEVTFEWEGSSPPTEKDLRDVFSAARSNPPIKPGEGYTEKYIPESYGGEDPYAGEVRERQSEGWMPEHLGGIPKWGIENPTLWGLRGAGLELYKQGVQPTVEALGMVAGSFGSPVVGTSLGYASGKKVGEMGGGYLERLGMPEELQRPQRGAIEELKKSAVDVAEPLFMGAAFSKAAKMMKPIDDKITAAVKYGIDKGIRPTVVGKKLLGPSKQYYQKAESAVKSIIENKNNLRLTNEFGEVSKKQIPQTLRQFQEAIDQTKSAVFKQYDALRKATGDSGAKVSSEHVVRALKQFLGDDAVKTIAPGNHKYAQNLIRRFTNKRTGTTERGLSTGTSEVSFKEFTPEETQEMIKILNESLKAFYKNPSYTGAKRAYVDQLVVNNLRKSMDDVVTNATGKSYQALKNKYGSLRAIEEEVGHRYIIDQRKNPKGLIDFSDVFTGYHAAKGLLTLDPATIGAAGAGKTVAWLYRLRNQPNRQIKNMFSTVEKLTNKKGVIESLPEISQTKVKPSVKASYRQRVPTTQKMEFTSGKTADMGTVKQRVPTTKQHPESYKIVPEHGTGMKKKVKR